MIVNYSEDGWEVITQRAHGILAAQFGLQWKKNERPHRWLETILAIAEHDDAEVELDGENLITDKGGPLNFSMKTFDKQHCENLFMLAITKSRYIALLTSMHMDFLYSPEEKTNSEAKSFLQQQRKLQAFWRRELKINKEEALKIYYLMEWCDALSLLICRKQLQPEQRAVEISYGPDKTSYYLYELKEKTITLDPWPFEIPAFEVRVESRMIPKLEFEGSADFRKAFMEAMAKENVYRVIKAKSQLRKKKNKV